MGKGWSKLETVSYLEKDLFFCWFMKNVGILNS
jgi:hypothetical protein